jgi:hypothetical protein
MKDSASGLQINPIRVPIKQGWMSDEKTPLPRDYRLHLVDGIL